MCEKQVDQFSHIEWAKRVCRRRRSIPGVFRCAWHY